MSTPAKKCTQNTTSQCINSENVQMIEESSGKLHSERAITMRYGTVTRMTEIGE